MRGTPGRSRNIRRKHPSPFQPSPRTGRSPHTSSNRTLGPPRFPHIGCLFYLGTSKAPELIPLIQGGGWAIRGLVHATTETVGARTLYFDIDGVLLDYEDRPKPALIGGVFERALRDAGSTG